MRALRRFTVRNRLPEPLAGLDDLALNLRWAWHPESAEVFSALDPQLWQQVEGDPARLLGAINPDRLARLATDRRFLRQLADAQEELADYLAAPRWYQEQVPAGPARVAYFSPEYGITELLPQYSGGLGILAGDHLKTASDLGVPLIGVGLLYRDGYFVQTLSRDGWQQERYPGLDPHGLPLLLVRDPQGVPLRVSVDLPGGTQLAAVVWRAQVGRVPLLLLDSDVEENAPAERRVTDRLYGGGTGHRLLQELLLGVGGVRALRGWARLTGEREPEVYHTNEGHAGFLGLERIRELMAAGLSFDEALVAVRAGTIFTTHTPVPAGIDRFPRELVAEHFGAHGPGACPGVPLAEILELGREDDPDFFNMAHMGLRLAQRANGVSRLHGEVSREMFRGLWPGFDADQVPIGAITNGVHAPTWMARDVLEIAERAAGRERAVGPGDFGLVERVGDEVIWRTRCRLRARLVDEVRQRLRASWLQRGAGEAELGWIATALDPDVLTIGFARRVPSYKRLTLMLQDPDRLTRILRDPARPVQLVVAGKAHPADESGKELLSRIVRFADSPEVRHRIAFLPDYDMRLARVLSTGCDVWLNNPVRPLEACGTSGMKAALNGCLNLSVCDGWWDEMFDGENGWAIPTAPSGVDAGRRDELEATALYELLEQAVIPRFYASRDDAGVPVRWVSMVRHTLTSLGPRVLAERMLRDYVAQMYVPAAQSARSVSAQGFRGAKELAAWTRNVRRCWPEVRVAHVESNGLGETPVLGAELTVRALVELAGLAPSDVDVELLAGPVGEADDLVDPVAVPMAHTGPDGGSAQRYEARLPLERTGSFGYSVRVLPRHRLLATGAELGLLVTA